MKCKYSMEDIENFYEGNVTTVDNDAISEHLKSCEECKIYYSSLLLTGKCVNRNERPAENVYAKIENSLDKNRYGGGKRWKYRALGILPGKAQMIKAAAAVLVVCLLAVLTINYRDRIGGLFNSDGRNVTPLSQSNVPDENIDQKINTNGGVVSKLILHGENGNKPTAEELERTRIILDKRLGYLGFNLHEINLDKDNGSLEVKVLWENGQKDDDFEKKLKELVQPGKVTFQEVDESKRDSAGLYLPTGVVIISNKDISGANIAADPQSNGVNIMIQMNDEGSKKFGEATARLIGKPIAVFSDDKLLTAPRVNEAITDGKVIINGSRDAEEAEYIVSVINSEALTTKVEVAEFKVIESGAAK